MSVSLEVQEAYKDDVGRGLARVDYDMLDPFGVEVGKADVVEIRGKKGNSTYAKRVPLFPSDEGKGMVRLDETIRSNLDISLGDIVHLNKAKPYKAEIVTIAPAEKVPSIDESYLNTVFESIVMKIGDRVRVRSIFGTSTYKVVKMTPTSRGTAQAAICTKRTKFVIRE